MKNHIKTIKKDDFIVLLFQLICMHNPNDGKGETRILSLAFVMYLYDLAKTEALDKTSSVLIESIIKKE